MPILTKKYRLFWNTSSKEIINNYKEDYSNSITEYSNNNRSYFESDNYQDILDKINSENLKDLNI